MGRDGKLKVFAKPWAMTTVMFLGMSICLPLAYLEEARARRGKLTAVEEPLVGNADVRPLRCCAQRQSLTKSAFTSACQAQQPALLPTGGA